MTDTPIWLDAFPHDFTVAHERTLRGLSTVPERVYYPGARRDGGRDGAWLRIGASTGRVWTGVFASELGAGDLSVISSWPQPSTLFVAVGGGPYLVDTRDPDVWSRLDRPSVRHLEAVPDHGLALLLDDDGCRPTTPARSRGRAIRSRRTPSGSAAWTTRSTSEAVTCCTGCRCVTAAPSPRR